LILVAMLALSSGCSKPDQPGAVPASQKAAEAQSRVKHGTNGEVILTLDAATQKAMGLDVGALSAAQLSPEAKGYGHVLDVSPLATLLADLATAQAASEASEAEFKRLKTLAAQNNASDRALQAAEAAATRDRAQADSTRLKLLANWGSAIAARQDLPAFVQSLGSLTTALIELDLPAGDSIEATPTGARLLTLSNPGKTIEAQFIGPAPMVDAQMQGRGFFFLVDPNTSKLAQGAAVSGLLTLPGEAQSGVAVPREAVIRYNGATWVYRQTSNETFERLRTTLDRPLENGWFVREGLKPGDKLVTAGAQQMLSEELKGSGE
jgi:hypothetical protein